MSPNSSGTIKPQDPYGLKIHTLKNGLTLYLSRKDWKPRIETRIVVKAGSSRDPETSTGAAHILEHLMFKGSRKIGASHWDIEKSSLNRLTDLFEQIRQEKSEQNRKALYKEIDRENQVAARLSLPGEYDRLLSLIGARGVNAYTSMEETVYKCDIPSIELERWIAVELDRFSEPVMRSFLTEIEAIYEEYNQDQDDDFSRARELLLYRLFPDHPYGINGILGNPEHIKAPSLKEIEQFRKTWYRPEHMAICLAGDFSVEETIELFEKTWGLWSPETIDTPVFSGKAGDIKKARYQLLGPDSEFTMTGFRFGGIQSGDYHLLFMLDLILNNSQAGLIDLNLVQKQKLLDGGSSLSSAGEYSWFVLYGTPGPGQSLGSVHRLLMKQIDLIKRGEFDSRLLKGVTKYLEIERVQDLETNGIVDAFAECFAEGMEWEDYLGRLQQIRSISKEELIEFVKKKFNDQYIRVDKKEGEDPSIEKVEKPEITPVPLEYNRESEFFRNFRKHSPLVNPPLFPDYEKELIHIALGNQVSLSCGRNEKNNLFELTFIFPEGKSSSKTLQVGGDYFPYIGTDRLKPEELQKEAFFDGLELNLNVDLYRTTLSLFGFQEDFIKALTFLDHVIRRGEGSVRTYRKYVQGLIKRRSDAKLSKRVLLFGGLYSWGVYGPDSPFRDVLSEKELKKQDPQALMDEIRRLFSLPHQIFYYGNGEPDQIRKSIMDHHPGDLSSPEPIRPGKIYTEKKAENKIYFAHHDMLQAEVFRVAPLRPFSEKLLPSVSLYNEFFGTGLNSLVFQEIREARGLAYTAYSNITVPERPEGFHILQSFLGTQSDKMVQAVNALDTLLSCVPEESLLFQEARASMVKSFSSERIQDADVFWSWWESVELGIDPAFRERVFRSLEEYSYSEMRRFFKQEILKANSNLLVLGSRDEVDLKALQEMGDFRELPIEELFNY